jgi:membrane protease YdiL (CAAX protease family)
LFIEGLFHFQGGSVEPEIQAPAREKQPATSRMNDVGAPTPRIPELEPPEIRDDTHMLNWALNGRGGLRAGWSLAIFLILFRLFSVILGTMAVALYPAAARYDFSPATALVSEMVPFLAMLWAVGLVGTFEHRTILDFNLKGPRRPRNFLFGMAAGFLALSVLIGALASGGWLHFGNVALTGIDVVKFGALWGCAFLVVGCVEEGIFRCFLQFTFTRSINFWWAAGIIGVACADLLLRSEGQLGIVAFIWMEPLSQVTGTGMWGVFAVALLGLAPCLWMQLTNAEGTGFWQAAWVTSTLFGFVHTGNNGENWIGILAAATIGFVFCVSVWVTGSAWWAIGCHAAWDWAETYFYGTADSGFAAKGHFLTASPAGNALWSGGADGPEGSLLVLGVILVLLVALIAIYGRGPAQVFKARRAEG